MKPTHCSERMQTVTRTHAGNFPTGGPRPERGTYCSNETFKRNIWGQSRHILCQMLVFCLRTCTKKNRNVRGDARQIKMRYDEKVLNGTAYDGFINAHHHQHQGVTVESNQKLS